MFWMEINAPPLYIPIALLTHKLWTVPKALENVFRVCIAWYEDERGWENSRQFCKTRDEVEGFHNYREFYQPLVFISGYANEEI